MFFIIFWGGDLLWNLEDLSVLKNNSDLLNAQNLQGLLK